MILVTTKTPSLKQAHLQVAASLRSIQSLQKSLLCQRSEKNKKIPRFAKIKSADTQCDTIKLIDKQTDINEKEKITAYNTRYKTLGFKWLYKQHLSHQSLVYLDSEVSPYSPTISYRHPLCITKKASRQWILWKY